MNRKDGKRQLLIRPEEPRCNILKLFSDVTLIKEYTGQLNFGSTYTQEHMIFFHPCSVSSNSSSGGFWVSNPLRPSRKSERVMMD
jgi:hypothetical protein